MTVGSVGKWVGLAGRMVVRVDTTVELAGSVGMMVELAGWVDKMAD